MADWDLASKIMLVNSSYDTYNAVDPWTTWGLVVLISHEDEDLYF